MAMTKATDKDKDKAPKDADKKKPNCCSRFCCCCCKKRHRGCCLCWHPCLWFLIPIYFLALVCMGLDAYVVYIFYEDIKKKTGHSKAETWTEAMALLSIITSLLLILLVQITYLLVYYAGKNPKSRKGLIFFCIFFALTLIAAIAVLTLTFICKEYCPVTTEVVDPRLLKMKGLIAATQTIRCVSIIRLILILLVFHIYLFYYCKYRQEENDNIPESNRRPMPIRPRKVYPSSRSKFLDANANLPNPKVVYFKI